MRKIALVIIGALAPAAGVFAGFGDVISSFRLPSPLNRPDCRGLASDSATLWTCDRLSAYRLSTTGSIISSFPIPGAGDPKLSYAGAVWDGQYIWYAYRTDSVPATVFRRYTTTGSFTSGFEKYGYEGSALSPPGLSWELGYLWCKQYKLTTAGSIVSSFTPPFFINQDIAYEGHTLWVGNRQITTTGSFVGSFPVPGGGNVLTGTTFDANYLWVINPTNYWVYQIDIGVVDVDPASFGKIKSLYK